MSPKLPAVTGKDLARVRGGSVSYFGVSTAAMRFTFARSTKRVVIPMHAGKSLKPKTLRAILEDLKLKPEEFQTLV